MTIGQIQCLRVISHKKGHISSPGQAKVFICGKLKIWCSWLNLNGQPIFSLQGTSGLYAWVSGWKLKGSLAQSPGNDLIVVFECAVYLRLHWIYLLRLYSFVPLTIHHNEGLIWKKWRFQITKKVFLICMKNTFAVFVPLHDLRLNNEITLKDLSFSHFIVFVN